MTEGEASKIILYLAAGFRAEKLGEPTIRIWQEKLTDVSFEAARIAAKHAVEDLEWMPAIATFLNLCDSAAVEVRAASRPALPAPPLNRFDETFDLAQRKAFHLWYTTCIQVAFRDGVRHTKECGSQRRDKCLPDCPFEIEVRRRYDLAAAEQGIQRVEEQAVYRCSRCRDTLFIQEEGHNTVSPCPGCHPEGRQRWHEGHWMSNHECEECRAGKRRLGGEPRRAFH